MDKNYNAQTAEIYNDKYIIERIQILFPKKNAREIAKEIDELLKTEFDINRDYTKIYPFALKYQLDDNEVDMLIDLMKTIDKKYRQSQNYLNIRDVITPVIIYKDENGDLLFGLQKTFVPAKSKIYYELPEIIISEKESSYSNKTIEQAIIKYIKESSFDVSNTKVNFLTNSFTPVSQSFTNQKSLPIIITVDRINKDDKTIKWFPVNQLDQLLDSNVNMSLQTKYALLLISNKYCDNIDTKEETNLVIDFIDDNIYASESDILFSKKYRFGVSKTTNMNEKIIEKINNKEVIKVDENSVYGLSNDSVQCVISRINKEGSVEVLLSKQLRSPFITEGYFDSNFYECPAGMIDDEDGLSTNDVEQIGMIAALREAKEETGIEASSAVKLCPDSLLSLRTEETSMFYLCEVPYDTEVGAQSLDEAESIDRGEWFALDDIDITTIKSPMPTKVALLETKKYYNKKYKKSKKYTK